MLRLTHADGFRYHAQKAAEESMATLQFPNRALLKGIHRAGPHLPYIITRDDKLAEGPNHFLSERDRGRISKRDPDDPRAKKLSPKTIRQCASRLTDYLTWMESSIAHPGVGSLRWQDTRRWLIEDLYEEALLSGYWSKDFWLTGHPSPLAYRSTVKSRVDEAILCGMWLQRAGYIVDFEESPGDVAVARERALATQSFEAIAERLASSGIVKVQRTQVRQDPGTVLPPSDREISEIIAILPEGTMQLVALSLYELGLRAFELAEQMKIPPSWFANVDRSIIGGQTLGYLPDLDVVFSNAPDMEKRCKWRVKGKFGKVRWVMIPPKLLRLLWKYATVTRKAILKDKPPELRAAHELFLNRRGKAIDYDDISMALRRANNTLNRQERITAHPLRHAYACKFIEVCILDDFAKAGIDPETASYDQFMRSGEGAIIVLQANLGHAEREMTMRYLKQLAGREMAFRYQNAFNNALDELTNSVDLRIPSVKRLERV